ncbi:MAG: hypothetical protein OYH77_02500 [Pseudomonadota bacterium]|nr:hypothetical protein [Pseudomonadota bacterium]
MKLVIALSLSLLLFSQVSVGRGIAGGIVSKIGQTAVGKKALGIVGAGIIACSGLLGCDNSGRVIVDDVIREDASYNNKYAEFVEFEIDGEYYMLYIEETDTGELLVEYDDQYGRLVFLQQSIGEFVPDHRDIGRDAYFIDVVNSRDVYLDGVVIDVTDNDYYVIEIYQHTDVDTGVESPYVRSYRRLVHKSLLVDDGGFQFYD